MPFKEQVEQRRRSREAAEKFREECKTGDDHYTTKPVKDIKNIPTGVRLHRGLSQQSHQTASENLPPPRGIPPPASVRKQSSAVDAVRTALMAPPKTPPPNISRLSGRALMQRKLAESRNSVSGTETSFEQRRNSSTTIETRDNECPTPPRVSALTSYSQRDLEKEAKLEESAQLEDAEENIVRSLGPKYKGTFSSPQHHHENNSSSRTSRKAYHEEQNCSDSDSEVAKSPKIQTSEKPKQNAENYESKHDDSEEDAIPALSPIDPATIPLSNIELKQFLYNPLPKPAIGTNPLSSPLCRCIIERDRSGPSKYLCPVYSFLIEDKVNGDRLLMVARKRPFSKMNYIISTNSNDLYEDSQRRSNGCLGKLRPSINSGTSGQEFVLHDSGLNPNRLLWNEAQRDSERLRKEEAIIVFSNEGSDRKIEIGLPAIQAGKLRKTWQPIDEDDSMSVTFRQLRFKGKQNVKYTDSIMCLNNHATKYDALSSCLVEYEKRANVVSTKNTLLQVSQPADSSQMEKWYRGVGKEEGERQPGKLARVVFRMGKIGKDVFALDFQYPLSPFQAFGIGLARFESMKLDLTLK